MFHRTTKSKPACRMRLKSSRHSSSPSQLIWYHVPNSILLRASSRTKRKHGLRTHTHSRLRQLAMDCGSHAAAFSALPRTKRKHGLRTPRPFWTAAACYGLRQPCCRLLRTPRPDKAQAWLAHSRLSRQQRASTSGRLVMMPSTPSQSDAPGPADHPPSRPTAQYRAGAPLQRCLPSAGDGNRAGSWRCSASASPHTSHGVYGLCSSGS